MNRFTNTEYENTNEFDNLIGNPPHWLISWGLTIFIIVFLLIILLLFGIKYQKTVSIPINLENVKISKIFIANENYIITKVWVTDFTQIKKNDTILTCRENHNFKANPKYIISKSNGIISFFIPLNSFSTKINQPLFKITSDSTLFNAFAQINDSLMNIIKVGQPVNIHLNQYTIPKYGVVHGNIIFVNRNQSEKKHKVIIKINQKIPTRNGMNIKFKENMEGRADVIIENQKLFNKIFRLNL